LTVYGANGFGQGSVVQWNGAARPTQFVGFNQLIAKISASDVSAPGTAMVTVNTPGTAVPTSSAVSFTIAVPVPTATIQPTATLVIPPQVIGTKSAPVNVTVTSSGQVPLVISKVTLADTNDFSETNNCPASLPVGQNCVIQVSFAPTSSTPLGPMLSQMTIADNTSASPEIVYLSASAADYKLSSNPGTASVAAGQSANISLTVQSVGDTLLDQVQLSCSGLPAGATCAFSSPTVTPNLSGFAVALTITTAGKASANANAGQLLTVLASGLWFLIVACRSRNEKRGTLAIVLVLAAIAAVGCGGGGSGSTTGSGSSTPPGASATPAGTYTITITGKDGAIQRTTTVSLTVTGS
jgi:hypothetical protein